ncbi:amino acid deaminase/aldolase [Paenibacillus sp. CR_12]|uniref:amino acid deaminase/aldolase n=1 Tax=Paenibacillus sp. CR_12 TaxID=3055793 RepID=UPI0035BFF9E3
MSTYEYYKEIFSEIPKPFALVDLDMLDDNAEAIAQAAGGKKVRLASKSIRSVDVLNRLLRSNPIFQGIMCYTAAEAVFLAEQGFDDLLLGYPQWQPEAIRSIVNLVGEGRSITLMVDSVEHVEHIEQFAKQQRTVIPLCIDVDMSVQYPGLHFGVWRSPVHSWEGMYPIVEQIIRSPWLHLDGIMGYEAQVAGVGDNANGKHMKNTMVRWLKSRSIVEAANRRKEAVERLAAMDLRLRFVNAGGTGSLDSSREEAWVTEITAGSGFYAPGLFDHYASFRYKPAAAYAVEVVRIPKAGIVTCMGGGYTASGTADKDKLAKPYLPSGLKLFPLEGAGEVQTPLRLPAHVELGLGDPVFFRHAKAGELCERFKVLYAVSQGRIVGEYATYRGMGECFL